MRKYKFRGKRKDNGEWVHGGIYVDQGKVGILTTEIINATAIIDEVDPATVGQYTGLEDKDGVEIYENDRVNISTNIYFFGDYTIQYDPQQCRYIAMTKTEFIALSARIAETLCLSKPAV